MIPNSLPGNGRIVVYNASGANIPPFAAMQIKKTHNRSPNTAEGGSVFSVEKPTDDLSCRLLFNGPSQIDTGKMGVAYDPTVAPVFAKLSRGSESPEVDLTETGLPIGRTPDSWWLRLHGHEFRSMGAGPPSKRSSTFSEDQFVLVVAASAPYRQIVFARLTDTHTKGGTSRANLLRLQKQTGQSSQNGSTERVQYVTDTTNGLTNGTPIQIRVFDPLSIGSLRANTVIQAVWDDQCRAYVLVGYVC